MNAGPAPTSETFAIVNGADVAVPWSFTDKSHRTSPAAGEFLEEGVDLLLDGRPDVADDQPAIRQHIAFDGIIFHPQGLARKFHGRIVTVPARGSSAKRSGFDQGDGPIEFARRRGSHERCSRACEDVFDLLGFEAKSFHSSWE